MQTIPKGLRPFLFGIDPGCIVVIVVVAAIAVIPFLEIVQKGLFLRDSGIPHGLRSLRCFIPRVLGPLSGRLFVLGECLDDVPRLLLDLFGHLRGITLDMVHKGRVIILVGSTGGGLFVFLG